MILLHFEFIPKNKVSLHASPPCENEECVYGVLLQVYYLYFICIMLERQVNKQQTVINCHNLL